MAMAAALAKVLRGGCSVAASSWPHLLAILRHPGSSPAAAPAAGMARLIHTDTWNSPSRTAHEDGPVQWQEVLQQ
ncbi:unnamed protein product [Urochloa humidicola]